VAEHVGCRLAAPRVEPARAEHDLDRVSHVQDGVDPAVVVDDREVPPDPTPHQRDGVLERVVEPNCQRAICWRQPLHHRRFARQRLRDAVRTRGRGAARQVARLRGVPQQVALRHHAEERLIRAQNEREGQPLAEEMMGRRADRGAGRQHMTRAAPADALQAVQCWRQVTDGLLAGAEVRTEAAL